MQDSLNFQAWIRSPRFAIQLLTVLIALLIIYVTVDSIHRHQTEAENDAARHIEGLAGLTTETIVRSLSGVRETLRLLSRMPVLREPQPSGLLIRPVRGLEQMSLEMATHLEEEGMFLYHQITTNLQNLERNIALTQAAARRFLYEMALFDPFAASLEGDTMPGLLPDSSSGSRSADASADGVSSNATMLPSAALLFGRSLRQELLDRVMPILADIKRSAELLDRSLGLGSLGLADPAGARNLLAASLSDRDLIRSYTVKSLSGQALAFVTEISEPLSWFGSWSGRSTFGHRAFYAGPVSFDEGLQRPLWEATVPLRNRDREAFAMLSSQVDLGFLSDLTPLAGLPPGGHLFVVDEDGVVIGHGARQMVVNQVNILRTNPELARLILEQKGIQSLSSLGTAFLATCRHLHDLDRTNLPGWSVVVMAPAQRLTGSSLWPWVCGMMVAVCLISVLLYVSEFIIDHVQDDEGTIL